MKTEWTVGEVAEMAHVTVRTLHHYDAIGLLCPSRRSDAGYRLYGAEDLRRLHQVIVFRELGFSLERTRALLDEPEADRAGALAEQRESLRREVRRTRAVIRAIDRAINALETEESTTMDRMFEGMEEFEHAPYAAEAEERWGHTEAYRESTRRARGYSKADWERIRTEGEAPLVALAELMAVGSDPAGTEARAQAELLRLQIHENFYPCDHRMHAMLAEMYEQDPRFTACYEHRAGGLAGYVAAAIRANAAANSV